MLSSDAVEPNERARPIRAAPAVNVNDTVCRIVDDAEELLDRLSIHGHAERQRTERDGNVHEPHPEGLDPRPGSRVGTQADDGANPKPLQSFELDRVGLFASIQASVHLHEPAESRRGADGGLAGRGQLMAGGRKRGGKDQTADQDGRARVGHTRLDAGASSRVDIAPRR